MVAFAWIAANSRNAIAACLITGGYRILRDNARRRFRVSHFDDADAGSHCGQRQWNKKLTYRLFVGPFPPLYALGSWLRSPWEPDL